MKSREIPPGSKLDYSVRLPRLCVMRDTSWTRFCPPPKEVFRRTGSRARSLAFSRLRLGGAC